MICNYASYGGNDGELEIAVMINTRIVSTDLIQSDDVVGYLSYSEASLFLRKVSSLPPVDSDRLLASGVSESIR